MITLCKISTDVMWLRGKQVEKIYGNQCMFVYVSRIIKCWIISNFWVFIRKHYLMTRHSYDTFCFLFIMTNFALLIVSCKQRLLLNIHFLATNY